MKSYPSLILISTKIRRRQNSMTLLCIIFAVFLVTAVFSMADMGVKMGQSRLPEKYGNLTLQDLLINTMIQTLFPTVGILFVLILTAAVLMISGNTNSSITQRIELFGMMRYLGMSYQQIIRFVRLEALNWCEIAIPANAVFGVAVARCPCAALRFIVDEEFSDIPLFGISMPGIVSGIVVGIVIVLPAVGAPIRRTVKVSPVTAVSGNSQNDGNVHHTVNTHLFKVETTLDIHYALSTIKNLVLMTGSFTLSIVLSLNFSVLIDFVGCIMPQSAGTSDINITSIDGSNTVSSDLPDTIIGMYGVKRVYGRRSSSDVSAGLHSGGVKTDIVSYDDFGLDCLVKDDMLKRGSNISKVYGNNKHVLTAWDKGSTSDTGDKIDVGNEELGIAGLLRYNPFNDNGPTSGEMTFVTSGTVFIRLAGVTDYSLIMVQTAKDVTDEDVTAVCSILDQSCVLKNLCGQHNSDTYFAFVFCIYASLTITMPVTMLDIINNIPMSVSSRIKPYEAMRAVGMDQYQITKMVAAEIFTCALTGGFVGCATSLLIYKLLYDIPIISHFSCTVLNPPAAPLLIVLFFVCMTTIAAVYTPAKQMRDMEITEIISES